MIGPNAKQAAASVIAYEKNPTRKASASSPSATLGEESRRSRIRKGAGREVISEHLAPDLAGKTEIQMEWFAPMATVTINRRDIEIGDRNASTDPGGATRRRRDSALLLASRSVGRGQLPDVPGRGRREEAGRHRRYAGQSRARLPDAGQGRHRHRHRQREGEGRPSATLEYLLLNHPLDCPTCDQAGECFLQDYSYHYGRGESRLKDDQEASSRTRITSATRSRCSPTAASCAAAACGSRVRSAARRNC